MHRKWLLIVGVIDLLILSALDNIAFQYHLYYFIFWFDLLMHLIGGLAIGLVSSYAYLKQNKEVFLVKKAGHLDWNKLLFFNISFSLVIGAAWEIFEVLFDRILVFSWLESLKDLLVGMVGSILAGLIAGIIALWLYKQKQKRLI
jgi:uncharacterized membrane protein